MWICDQCGGGYAEIKRRYILSWFEPRAGTMLAVDLCSGECINGYVKQIEKRAKEQTDGRPTGRPD